jgi:hypothetical protein
MQRRSGLQNKPAANAAAYDLYLRALKAVGPPG